MVMGGGLLVLSSVLRSCFGLGEVCLFCPGFHAMPREFVCGHVRFGPMYCRSPPE